MGETPPTIHASAVRIGAAGVLIRGASGAGKSTLAARLVLDAPRCLPQGELVADDRVLLSVEAGRLVARPPGRLAGLLEVRGLGVRRLPHAASCVLTHVIDLEAEPLERLPPAAAHHEAVRGVALVRLVAATVDSAVLLLAAALSTGEAEI